MIEITKACIVAFMKARNSLVVWCREKKKTEDGENVFLMLLLKIFCLHQKVVYGWPSIKWTSWNGNFILYNVILLKVEVQFVRKILLEMVIGQQMKEEVYDQN